MKIIKQHIRRIQARSQNGMFRWASENLGAMASRWQRFAKKRPSQNEELILPPNYDEDQIKKDLHGIKS